MGKALFKFMSSLTLTLSPPLRRFTFIPVSSNHAFFSIFFLKMNLRNVIQLLSSILLKTHNQGFICSLPVNVSKYNLAEIQIQSETAKSNCCYMS